MKNWRSWVPVAAFSLVLVVVCALVLNGCKKAGAISWTPTPCVTTSPAGTPVGPGNVLPCQPTWPGYVQPSPGASPSATPTPGAIVASPSSIIFSGPSASPTSVSVTEPYYGGAFQISPSPAGIISASITAITGGQATINLAPKAIGTASVGITNSSTQTATVSVAVSPTPGPLTVVPGSVAFANPSAAATTAAISDPNYGGALTASPQPAGIASASITGTGPNATLNLSPVAPGSTVVSVSDGTNITPVSVTVSPTPGPITFNPSSVVFANPSAAPTTVAVSDPSNTASITASPTPVGQVSASIAEGSDATSWTITLTPQSVGTPGVTVSDGNSTVTLPVTVNAAATPGPIVLSPTSATFSGPTPAPITVTISETNYSGNFTVTPSATGIVSTTTPSGGSFTITPTAWGTTTLTVSNTSTQTNTLSVTVNSVASVYATTVPATPLPIALTSYPTPGAFTFIAQVKCNGSANTGNTIIGIGTVSDMTVKEGTCGGSSQTNPSNSTAAQVYLNTAPSSSAQSGPANSFNAAQTYIIAATDNGSVVTYWDCTYPTVVCTQETGAGAGYVSYTGSSGYLGAATDGTRVFGGDIWNVLEYPTGIVWSNPATMQSFISSTYNPFVDPYPSPSPTATPVSILAQPYQSVATAGPLATSLPTPSTWSYIAQVKCPGPLSNGTLATPNPNGNQILQIGTSPGNLSLNGGLCNGGTNNPAVSSGLKAYIGTGQYAGPTGTASALAANPTQYIIGASDDGTSTLSLFVCTYPTISCTQSTASITAPLAWAGSTPNTYIGAADNIPDRLFSGDIWNVRTFNIAFNLAGMTKLANSPQIVPDPYTSPNSSIPSISTSYTDANPPPVGWRPRSITPSWSSSTPAILATACPDAQHCNWPAICAAGILDGTHTTNKCSASGDPPYTAFDSSGGSTIVSKIWSSPLMRICPTAGYSLTYTGADSNTYQGNNACDPYNNSEYGYGIYFTGDSGTGHNAGTTLVNYIVNCSVFACGWNGSYSSSSTASGSTQYLPIKSLPQGAGANTNPSGVNCANNGGCGGDHHIFMLDEYNAMENECWTPGGFKGAQPQDGFTYPTTSNDGSTYYCGTFSRGPLTLDEQGVPGPGNYPSGGAPFSGSAFGDEAIGNLIRPEEMAAAGAATTIAQINAAIPHAIGLSFSFNSSATSGNGAVWPSGHTDGKCGTSTNLGHEGMLVYLDTAGYNADVTSWQNGKQSNYWMAVMAAGHNYGFLDAESSNCTSTFTNFLLWGSGNYNAANITSPWDNVISNISGQGGLSINQAGSTSTGKALWAYFAVDGDNSSATTSNLHVINMACPFYLMYGTEPSGKNAGDSC